MAYEHVCEVCFTRTSDHYNPADDPHFPPLCCPGCPCGETRAEEEDDDAA